MPLAGPPLTIEVELARLLEKGLAANPDAPALVSIDEQLTWRELDAASTRLARHYLALGLKPGDRVATLMPNRAELVIQNLACMKAGFASTPLNYRYQAPEIDHALEVSEASVLLHHAERDADLALSKFADKLPLGRISFGATDGRTPSYEQFMQTEPAALELTKPSPDAVAFVFFTSGSTGKPKGVTHSHRSFGSIVASTIAGLEISAADVFLTATSYSHIAATHISFGALAAGVRIDVPHRLDGDEMLPLLANTRPTFLCMLPAALFALVRDHNATSEHFHSLRLCVSGGDKVSGELEREFTAIAGKTIDELYGMTETGMSTVNPPDGQNKIGSIGKLVAGYEASIRDANGNEVPAGAEGRLWIRSAANMIGYWNQPDATAETVVDGWLDTGDVVAADADGYLWFRGRQKQIIVHDGSNITPQEIEESLLEHPAVAAVGVIGIHNLVHGENVRAYVELKPGVTPPTAAKLIKFSRASVGYKAPDEIVFLDAMPLNATGKVDRVTLKRMAEAATA
ncbi:MAG: acyl-CoA synthetase [Pirellula sp.]|nr:acyl-CoA synthetase [Pirellula sp.]